MESEEYEKPIEIKPKPGERKESLDLPTRREPYPQLAFVPQASFLIGGDFHLPAADMAKRLSIRLSGVFPSLKKYLSERLPAAAVDQLVGFFSLIRQQKPDLVIDLGDRDVHEAGIQDRAYTAQLYEKFYASTPSETGKIFLQGNHDLDTPENFRFSLETFGIQFGYQRVGKDWLLIFTDTNLLSPRFVAKLVAQASTQVTLETQISSLQALQQEILEEARGILSSEEEPDRHRKAVIFGHQMAGLGTAIAKLPNVHAVVTGHRHFPITRKALMLKDANNQRPEMVSVDGFSLAYPILVYTIRPRLFDLITLDGPRFQHQSLALPPDPINDIW